MSVKSAPRIGAMVLAAGQGTRFAAQTDGAFKLLAPLHGMPLVRHVVQAAISSRARPIVVVTGHAWKQVTDALAGLDVMSAHNAAYASGLSTSVKAGLTTLADEPVDGTFVLLADMPGVTANLLDRLIDVFAADPSLDAVVPVHDGRRGNPVLLGRALFPAMRTLSGDEGARRILAAAAHVAEVEIAEDAVALDIDTPDILDAFRRR